MTTRILKLGSLATLGLLLGLAPAQSQEATTPEKGITVLARGPVHEAFAQPQTSGPLQGQSAPKQPPQPIPEEPPEQKPEGDSIVWIPGYWSWDADRNDFVWVSGVWRAAPPDRRWVPGYWTQADQGWQWVPGFWAAAERAQVEYQPQPPASLDQGPNAPAPDDDSTYVPGTWVWRQSAYVWRPGYWLSARPGWLWTAASYCWSPRGYVFVDGYWDYPLEDRGLLFAPVAFEQPVYAEAGFAYRPNYCIDLGGMLSALFVRPGCGYYFGDYYGPAYANAGYQGWLGYGARCFDPLFSYYNWHGGNDWYNGCQALYAGRWDGSLARPQHTFVEQSTFFEQNNISNNFVRNQTNITNRITNRTNIDITNRNNLRLVNSLADVRQSDLRSAQLNRGDRTEVRQAAQRLLKKGRRGAL